ncbi:YciI family protein [Leisingera sp. SS27]|uniref:YciI family protein n=1 Tax=Leisingera sp. SS27 TaxID=2979462 RepID=UPI00233140AB|nr:YciI family protein [Leisingera sp. SS27]MDC0659774.1 YciI family protein [Leisingera sp. SS27]
MYFILLTFAEQKGRLAEFLDGHKAWLQQGFADGVFLAAGSMTDGEGGAILAVGESEEALFARVAQDPFVTGGVVEPEIIGVAPTMMDPRLDFLRAGE